MLDRRPTSYWNWNKGSQKQCIHSKTAVSTLNPKQKYAYHSTWILYSVNQYIPFLNYFRSDCFDQFYQYKLQCADSIRCCLVCVVPKILIFIQTHANFIFRIHLAGSGQLKFINTGPSDQSKLNPTFLYNSYM